MLWCGENVCMRAQITIEKKNAQMRAGKIRFNLVVDAVRCSIFNGKQERRRHVALAYRPGFVREN